MNTMMADGVNVLPFTIVRVSDENKQYTNEFSDDMDQDADKLIIKIENIKLTQAPTETFNMNVEFARPMDYFRGKSSKMRSRLHLFDQHLDYQSYCVKLKFLNHLHEFNKDYKYEIVCKIVDSEKQGEKFLFSCTKLRLTDSVKISEQFTSKMDLDLTAKSECGVLYFCIRRHFNVGKDMICNERLNIAVSILRNTGCDVVLKAKDGNICAHKSMLSHNSEVFQAMFAVEMKEKQSGIIDVSDFEKRVINKMLDYLYTGKIGELDDMTEALFKLAHRYQLHDLCRCCEEYYTFNVKVDNDNIVEILKLIDLYELKNLKEGAVNLVKNHEEVLVEVPGYRDYLIQSINSDNLVSMLLLSEKYYLADLKVECFDFLKNNYRKMMKNPEFLNLFLSNGELMRDYQIYVLEK